MTDTLVTSAPSVILASLNHTVRATGLPWDRGYLVSNRENENTFNARSAREATDNRQALRILREAHALDVLQDAYTIAALEHTHPNVFAVATRGYILTEDDFHLAPVDPFAAIDAQIHEEFPGPIPDAKLSKLRALAQERVDLKAQVESYRVQLRNELDTGKALREQLEQPITDGKDPRIERLMRRAAEVATAEEYCEVYDNIATQVGFPTRSDLGMSKRNYSVTITRVMSLTPSEAAALSVRDVTSNVWACSLDYEVVEED